MGSIKLQLRSTLSPKVVKTKARPSTFVASLLHTYLVTAGLDLALKPELELCIDDGAGTLDLEETVGGEALSKGTVVEVRRRRKARRPPSSPLLLPPRSGIGNEREDVSRGTGVTSEASTEEGGGVDEWEETPSRPPRPRQMSSGLAVCTSAYSSSTPTVASRSRPGSSVSPEDSSTSKAIAPTPPTRSLSDEFDYDNLDDALFTAFELPPIPDEMPSRLLRSPSQSRMSTTAVGVSPGWAPPPSEPGCILPIRYGALRRSIDSKGKVEGKAAVGVSGVSKRWDGTKWEKERPATDFLGQVHCPALASASNSPSRRSAPDWEELSPAPEPRRAQPDDDINDDLPQWVVATQVSKPNPTTSLPPEPEDGASSDGDADELDQLDPDSQEREMDRASMEILTRMPGHSPKKPAIPSGPAHSQPENPSAQMALSTPHSAPSHRPPPLDRPQVCLGPLKPSHFASTCPTFSPHSDPRPNPLDARHSCSPTNPSLSPPSPSSLSRPTKKAKLSSTALRKPPSSQPPSLPLSSLPLYHSHPRYQPSMPAVQRQDARASVAPSVTEPPPPPLVTKTFSTYLPAATPASPLVAELCSPITPRAKLAKFSFQRPSTGAAAPLSSVSATASTSPAPRQKIASGQSIDEDPPPSSEPWDDDEDAVFDRIEDSILAELELPVVAPNKKETPISMVVSFSPSTSPSASYAPQQQPSPVTFHDIDSTVSADDDAAIDRLMLGCKGLLGTQIAKECGLFGGEDDEDDDDEDEVAIYGPRYKTPPPPSQPLPPPKPLVAKPTPPDLDADVSLSLRLTALIPPPSTPPEFHTAYHAAHLPQSILHQILAYAIDPSRTTNVSFLLVSHLFHALSRPLLYTDVSLRSLNGWAALFLPPSSSFTDTRVRGARRADDYAHVRKLSLLSPAPMPNGYADDPGDDDEAMKQRRQIALAINMTLAHHRLAYDKTTGPRPLFPRLERLTIDLSASLGQTQLAQFNLDFLSALAPLPAGGFSRLASGRSREATTMSWHSQQPRPPLDVVLIGARDPSQVLGVLACVPGARGVRLRWPERGARAVLEAVARNAREQGRIVWLPSTEGDTGWAENWVDEEERKESWRRRARK